MTQNDKPWWEGYLSRFAPSVEKEEVARIVAEAEIRGRIDAFSWLLDHASGGGDWRRKCMMEIERLRINKSI